MKKQQTPAIKPMIMSLDQHQWETSLHQALIEALKVALVDAVYNVYLRQWNGSRSSKPAI